MRRSLTGLALAMVLPLPILLGVQARANVVVQPGETLSEIAARHGVSLTRLMQANGITNPDLVFEGQRLVLPGGGSGQAASGGRSGGSGSGSVTVQPGDTLSDIAARHGLSMERLMQLNGISNPDLVFVGQRLVVAASGRSAPSSPAPSQPTAPYTVQSGETLSDIASRFGTSTERLMQLNRISNPDLVLAGTRLAVPVRAGTGSSRPREHVVQPGENLSSIAERYGMSVERLISINNITDADMLWAGSPLRLQPPTAPRPAAASAPRASASAAPRQAARPRPSAQPPAPTPSTTAAVASAPRPQPQPQPQPQAQPQPQPTSQPAPRQASAPTTTSTAAATTRSTAAPTATAPAPTPRQSGPQAQPSATRPSQAAPTPSTRQSASTAGAARSPAATSAPTTSRTAGAGASPSTGTPSRQPASQGAAPTTARSTPSPSATSRTTPSAATARGSTVAARTSTAPQSGSSRPRPSGSSTSTGSSASRSTAGRTPAADWRRYGPLQVDWANWQSMGGSYVTPTLNGDGQGLYLAINCSARKLNATSQSGQWKSWDSPQTDFEQRLINDLCRAKGS